MNEYQEDTWFDSSKLSIQTTVMEFHMTITPTTSEMCLPLFLEDNGDLLKKFLPADEILKISEAGSIFIEYMRHLRQCIAKRLAVSPCQELADEQNLRLTWIRNAKTKAVKSVLLDKLEIQRNEGNAQLAQRDVAIKKNEELIEKMKKCSKDDIKKRINESEKNMINDWRDSESRQEILQAQLIENEARFEQLLSEHLRSEKSLKAKKIKVESQLLTVLSKYDADIGDLQNELDELMEGFNEEKRQMRELQERFDIQEVEYIRLMTQKAEEERIEHERRVNFFTTSRAARIIQRAWRKYIRRKRRRKGKRRK
ncbi:uncharacterized protein LOC126238522 isoform X1 [Schistocerca nitens]|uniref:uncharacterized protein LOC126238522 isoform X1 n=2 Tax=Schistocerca nitens TaxID=7011 RepID=UPI002118E89A|nr:uncharacterized protein LOC126238522 isoform X1 [Schistocerca nitens]